MSSSTADQTVTAANVRVELDAVTIELSDRRVLSVPIAWYPRSLHGSPQERKNWRLIAGGRGIHWPEIDEDISVDNLLLGKQSGESQTSFKKWLDSRSGA